MDNASPSRERAERRCRSRPMRRPSSDGSSSDGAAALRAAPTAEKKWYIVHTYSGHENKAKLTLLERVRTPTSASTSATCSSRPRA